MTSLYYLAKILCNIKKVYNTFNIGATRPCISLSKQNLISSPEPRIFMYHQYEDRGTVDDKGDVHIVRKYLPLKKTATTLPMPVPMQSELNRQKQLPPISPPSSLGTNSKDRDKPVKSTRNNTRYATMLSMSAILGDDLSSRNEKTEVLTDINDNLQLDVVKDQQTYQKNAIETADSFRNFDMWSSNLVSQLPTSPANSGSSKESPKTTSSLSRSIDNRYSNSVSNHRYPCHSSRSFGKTIDQNQLIVSDAVRYQAMPHHQNRTPCYVLLPQSYLCPKDAIVTYPQSSFVNGLPDEQPYVPLAFANCDRRSLWYNDNQIGSIAIDKDFIVGDGESRRDRVSAKPETDIATGHVQNYPPNIMLNFTPIYDETTSPSFVSLNAMDDEKRPRPILKQTMTGRAWL